MKINKNFVLRQVAQNWIVLSLADENVNFTGMMSLNESGVLLWNALENGAEHDDLVKVLTSEYIVSLQQAETDVDEFIQKIMSLGCIDME